MLGGWAILAFLVTPLLPVVVQRFIVEPNEFSREQQYIERNIAMTRQAYDLNDVEVTDLTGQDPIVPAELPADEPPLSNVRIWDYRVVNPVYQQLQSFVPYYEFHDIDVDWYTIDGQPVQVLISGRELNIDGLPETARTWTNRHLAYTHGFGAVVSPVSQVSPDGWPEMIVRDIPIVAPPDLAIERRKFTSANSTRSGSSSTPTSRNLRVSTNRRMRVGSKARRPGRSVLAIHSRGPWRP
jgi:uncharacterized membrane protein (UPF0182 family)